MLLLGIDVGWSEVTRSSSVALMAPKPVADKVCWKVPTVKYCGDGGQLITVGNLRLTELLQFLPQFRVGELANAFRVAVIDGPLGPTGCPKANRDVDGMFRRGDFYGRMQPADVAAGDGPTYVNATYQILAALLGSLDGFRPWTGGERSGICVAETHPTVGLALSVPMHEPAQIPSRRRPLLPLTNANREGAIRAKSDFYWRMGGNIRVSDLLRSQEVRGERNHDRVASLYCLATAVAISDEAAIVAGSADSGVYCFPNIVHTSWTDSLKDYVIEGNMARIAEVEGDFQADHWGFANAAQEAAAEVDEADSDIYEQGDTKCLLLNDNGGVWERHNDWLSDLGGPVRIKSKETPNTVATLRRARANGQWTMEPTSLAFARDHGFVGNHLSIESFVTIPITVVPG